VGVAAPRQAKRTRYRSEFAAEIAHPIQLDVAFLTMAVNGAETGGVAEPEAAVANEPHNTFDTILVLDFG